MAKPQCWLLVFKHFIFPQFLLALPFKGWRQHFFPGHCSRLIPVPASPHHPSVCMQGNRIFSWWCLWMSISNIFSALETFEIAVLPYTMKGKLLNLVILENREEQTYLTKKGIQDIHRSLLQSFKLPIILWTMLHIPPHLQRKKKLHGFCYLGLHSSWAYA